MEDKEKILIAISILATIIIICGTIILLVNTSRNIYIQYLQDNGLPLVRDNCTLYYNNETHLWRGINCTCLGCSNYFNETDLSNYSEIIYGDGERQLGWPKIRSVNIYNESGGNTTI